MFGFSWSEILIIGVVALVFIGPNDLPKAMKTAARWMSAARKLAREFQGHVDDLVREAELDELRDQARKLAAQPLAHLESLVDPDREIAKGIAAPDNLHELLTGESAVTPVADSVRPGAIMAPEPAAAMTPIPEPAPTPEPAPAPKPKRKPAAKAADAPPKPKAKPRAKKAPAE
jgi:sec-independent protein translocase protein TatB